MPGLRGLFLKHISSKTRGAATRHMARAGQEFVAPQTRPASGTFCDAAAGAQGAIYT